MKKSVQKSEPETKVIQLSSHNILEDKSPALSGDHFHNAPPYLDGWMLLFLQFKIHGVKSAKTLKLIELDLKYFYQFFQEYNGSNDIRAWSPQVTTRFIQHRQKLGEKPSTILRRLSSLSSFGKWTHGLRPDLFPLGVPTVGVRAPRQEALLPRGLTGQQVSLLIDVAQNAITLKQGNTKKSRVIQRPYRNYAILQVLLGGGLRREEVVNLTLEQFQGRKFIDVKCKGNVYRNVLLPQEVAQAIQTYISQERALDAQYFPNATALFLKTSSRQHASENGSLSVRSINKMMDALTTAANAHLPEEKKFVVTPHMLRHTHALDIMKRTKDLTYVQRRLGHQSLNFIARYTQMTAEEEFDVLDSLGQ